MSNRKRRKSLSPTVRFDILERDSHTCRYCGAKAPEVRLHVDHIVPVCKGGGNEYKNLVTACVACNLGKSTRELRPLKTTESERQRDWRVEEYLALMFSQSILETLERRAEMNGHPGTVTGIQTAMSYLKLRENDLETEIIKELEMRKTERGGY